MGGTPRGEPGSPEPPALTPDAIRARRRARREEERQRRRRFRARTGAIGVGLTGVGIALVALVGGGGSGGPAGAELAALASQQADLAPHPGPVPILMYHVLGAPPPTASIPELFVSDEDFEEQMDWLQAKGFVGVTLRQVHDAWTADGELPAKPIVISFDDGYRSQYEEGLPVLRALGWPAELDLKVESLDQGELTEEMVGEMLGSGWEVASHTATHADVSQLSGAPLHREIAGSKRELESRLDTEVEYFCYPSGRYDAESIAAVKDAGFIGATTTDPGLASRKEPFTLERVRVDGSDGLAGLREKMRAEGAT